MKNLGESFPELIFIGCFEWYNPLSSQPASTPNRYRWGRLLAACACKIRQCYSNYFHLVGFWFSEYFDFSLNVVEISCLAGNGFRHILNRIFQPHLSSFVSISTGTSIDVLTNPSRVPFWSKVCLSFSQTIPLRWSKANLTPSMLEQELRYLTNPFFFLCERSGSISLGRPGQEVSSSGNPIRTQLCHQLEMSRVREWAKGCGMIVLPRVCFRKINMFSVFNYRARMTAAG